MHRQSKGYFPRLTESDSCLSGYAVEIIIDRYVALLINLSLVRSERAQFNSPTNIKYRGGIGVQNVEDYESLKLRK